MDPRSERRRRVVAAAAAGIVVVATLVGLGMALWLGVSTSATPAAPVVLAPGQTPPGGVSRSDAIRIAAVRVSASREEIDGARAVERGDPHLASKVPNAADRWIWIVDLSYFPGPTSGGEVMVRLDFFSGVILDVTSAYA